MPLSTGNEDRARTGPICLSPTNYLYDGPDISDELDNTGNVSARYTHGPGADEPLTQLRSASTNYYQADGIGSVTSLTNPAGTIAATYSYDTFGNLSDSTGLLANPLRYTGRELDQETELFYYRARYYDPAAGRFMSEDPIGWVAGPNVYAYVGNDPLSFIDPDGLKAHVSNSGNTINVTASITIYGPRANAALAAQWQQIINDAWNNGGNNFHHGNCTVVFNITVNADPAHNKAAQATPADNKVYVRPNGFRSWVVGTPGASYGEWSADGTWDKAHEAGHMFHLPDDYHDVTVNGQTVSVPNTGHSGHMMGDYNGSVNQHEIDDLLHNNGCGCNTH